MNPSLYLYRGIFMLLHTPSFTQVSLHNLIYLTLTYSLVRPGRLSPYMLRHARTQALMVERVAGSGILYDGDEIRLSTPTGTLESKKGFTTKEFVADPRELRGLERRCP